MSDNTPTTTSAGPHQPQPPLLTARIEDVVAILLTDGKWYNMHSSGKSGTINGLVVGYLSVENEDEPYSQVHLGQGFQARVTNPDYDPGFLEEEKETIVISGPLSSIVAFREYR